LTAKRWIWLKKWTRKDWMCRSITLKAKKWKWLEKRMTNVWSRELWAEKRKKKRPERFQTTKYRKTIKTKDAAIKRIEGIRREVRMEKIERVETERKVEVGGGVTAGKVEAARKGATKAAVATGKAAVVIRKEVKIRKGEKVKIPREERIEKESVARKKAGAESQTGKEAGIRKEETGLPVGTRSVVKIRKEVSRGKDVAKKRMEVKAARVAIRRNRLETRKNKSLEMERKVGSRQMVGSPQVKRRMAIVNQGIKRKEEEALRVDESQEEKAKVVASHQKLKRAQRSSADVNFFTRVTKNKFK